MGLRITTLSENTATMSGCLAEWGLSILVETDEARVLLDTGKSISASHNADVLGVDLSQIDRMVLSHGHFDHTGGLRDVLAKMGGEVEIIAHPDMWQAKYHRNPSVRDKHARHGVEDRYIGIPFRREELESLGAVFNLTRKPVKISNNIMTTGEVPMVNDFEDIDPDLYVKEDSGWQPDRVMDDMALIINSDLGLVVVLGCAHRGIINTLYHAQQLTGIKQIHTVVGGAHLISASAERVRLTIAALKELDIKRLGLCHCTGMPAVSLLAQEFGERFFFNNAGTRFSLP